ncbi:hypothetical protein [Mucilaginibacter sp.]|uniref:hypothetical protein n=1 Tax=Mucilaginibacter sp. TaxID=1882438 RepID=UPI002631EFE3|nr:hypothetical protein [Mucilaginibacter sp.]MDB4919820.1 hypothetical protein [Mucilaginibacter sp.]
MMQNEALKIPTEFLPENWAKDVAAKFNLSRHMVRSVANGKRKNNLVFDHLLELAVQGKAKAASENAYRIKLLTKLIA